MILNKNKDTTTGQKCLKSLDVKDKVFCYNLLVIKNETSGDFDEDLILRRDYMSLF